MYAHHYTINHILILDKCKSYTYLFSKAAHIFSVNKIILCSGHCINQFHILRKANIGWFIQSSSGMLLFPQSPCLQHVCSLTEKVTETFIWGKRRLLLIGEKKTSFVFLTCQCPNFWSGFGLCINVSFDEKLYSGSKDRKERY